MKAKKLFKLLPVLGLSVLISCNNQKQDAAKKEETTTTAAVKVKTTLAKPRTVDKTTTYTATVQADITNNITPAMPGRIEKIYVEIGQNVSKGQLLVQMESSNLQQQKTQLANLQKDYERYSELLKVGGITQQQVDQIKTQIDMLNTALKNLQDNTQLRSPINGIVTARNYDNGDVFAQKPILTVQQLNPLKAVVYVSESNFRNVKLNMPADIRLDIYDDELFSGKVGLIYPTIDAGTHTFGVEVNINNKNMKIRPGMYSRVTLNFGTKQSIVIPDATIQKQAGANDKYVYVIEKGLAKYRKVELGQHLGEEYEILSGLSDGETVVTAGQARLIDGATVEIINN